MPGVPLKTQAVATSSSPPKGECNVTDTGPCLGGKCSNSHYHGASAQLAACASNKPNYPASIHGSVDGIRLPCVHGSAHDRLCPLPRGNCGEGDVEAE